MDSLFECPVCGAKMREDESPFHGCKTKVHPCGCITNKKNGEVRFNIICPDHAVKGIEWVTLQA